MKSKIFSALLLLATLFASLLNVHAGPGIIGFTSYMDRDASNFVARAGITNTGQRSAIDGLVRDLKRANLWTNKLHAFYPFCGGSSNSHKFNLVSTNYTITWRGAVVHNTNGVTGGGTNIYGTSTYDFQAVGASSNTFHLYVWARTNNYSVGKYLISTTKTPGTNGMGIRDFTEDDVDYRRFELFNPADTGQVADATNGVTHNFIVSFTNSALKAFLRTDTYSLGDPFSVRPLFYTNAPLVFFYNGVATNNSTFSSGTLKAASVGLGLTPAEAARLFVIVNKYQTALRRLN